MMLFIVFYSDIKVAPSYRADDPDLAQIMVTEYQNSNRQPI